MVSQLGTQAVCNSCLFVLFCDLIKMDHKKTYSLGADPVTGFAVANVARQDSKDACKNVVARLQDPTVAYTREGALLVCRVADKAKKPVPAASLALGNKTLNRDSTPIHSATAMIVGTSEGRLMNDHLVAIAGASRVAQFQAQCDLAKQRAEANEPVPDEDETEDDVSVDSSVVSMLADLADTSDPVVKYHRSRVELGLAAKDDFDASWEAYAKIQAAQGAQQPDTKPAATPTSKRRISADSSTVAGSNNKKKRGT